MQLIDFDWRERAVNFAKPERIRWASAKTGVVYLSSLSHDGWLKTRAIEPPADFSADVWQGYEYLRPSEVLQAIVNRVRGYGHEL
jgi:hypothetical protein